MATGKLWQMSGDAVQAITAGIAGYVMKTGHKPACVRTRDETLVAGGAAGVTVAACATVLGRTTGATGKQLKKLGATGAERCGDEQIKTIWQLSPLHQRTLRRLKPEWFL